MSEIIQAAYRARRPYAPHQEEQLTTWMCTDNGLRPGNTELYRQIAGSAAGVGHDWAVAMEMLARQKNSRSKMSERSGLHVAPTHVLGSIAAQTLRHQKERPVQMLLHTDCVGEPVSKYIDSFVTQQKAQVFDRAQRILPGITTGAYEHIADIYGQLYANMRIAEPDKAARQITQGGSWEATWHSTPRRFEPVERIQQEYERASPYFLVDYGTSVAYDLHAAHQTENVVSPAFHLSMGDIPGDIAEPLDKAVPCKVENFLAATAVRHGAIAAALGIAADNILRLEDIA